MLRRWVISRYQTAQKQNCGRKLYYPNPLISTSAAALRGRGVDRRVVLLVFRRPLANMTLRSVPDAFAPKRNEYQNRRGHGGPLLIIIIISRSFAVDPFPSAAVDRTH